MFHTSRGPFTPPPGVSSHIFFNAHLQTRKHTHIHPHIPQYLLTVQSAFGLRCPLRRRIPRRECVPAGGTQLRHHTNTHTHTHTHIYMHTYTHTYAHTHAHTRTHTHTHTRTHTRTQEHLSSPLVKTFFF